MSKSLFLVWSKNSARMTSCISDPDVCQRNFLWFYLLKGCDRDEEGDFRKLWEEERLLERGKEENLEKGREI